MLLNLAKCIDDYISDTDLEDALKELNNDI